MARRDKGSNNQNTSNASTSKKPYWLLLLLLILLTFGVLWITGSLKTTPTLIEPKPSSTNKTDIPNPNVADNEKPEDNELTSETSNFDIPTNIAKRKGTNKSTDSKKDEPKVTESPDPVTIEEPSKPNLPVIEEEQKVFPPVISSAKLESSVNNLYELRVNGGANGPEMLESEIEKIASMLAPGAKIYYKSSPKSNSIGLPKELKKYLREVGLLYKEEKFIIENFQYDPNTGKIVGFTLCKTK